MNGLNNILLLEIDKFHSNYKPVYISLTIVQLMKASIEKGLAIFHKSIYR